MQTLRIVIICVVIIFILLVLNLIRKNKLNMKYALVWLFSGCAMIIAVGIPNFLETIASWFGFELVSNMVFAVAIFILILICISLTVIASSQSNRIRLLIQEVSLLKREMENIHEKEK